MSDAAANSRPRRSLVARPGAKTPAMPPAPKPKALIAEDDMTQRLILHECVAGAGFEVFDAADGAEAVELARAVKPDIVLLDVIMPNLSGFDACRQIRLIPELSGVPILIVTGSDDDASIDEAFAAGASDFLAKPLNWRLVPHRLKFIARISQMDGDLRASKARAEAGNVAKTNFIANMSHELRTPLNAIIGFADVIQGEVLGPLGTPEYKEYIGDIKRSGKHLLELITDILEWSKLEAGQIRLNPETTALATLIDSCVRMVAPIAESKGIHLSADVDRIDLTTDQRSARQILINLLSNAIKFSPSGTTVKVVGRATDADQVRIEVIDQGIGIPGDKLNDVLRPFFQVDDSLARQHEGVGLGLTIATSLTSALGGKLDISSELGNGTTVGLTLPLALAPPR